MSPGRTPVRAEARRRRVANALTALGHGGGGQSGARRRRRGRSSLVNSNCAMRGGKWERRIPIPAQKTGAPDPKHTECSFRPRQERRSSRRSEHRRGWRMGHQARTVGGPAGISQPTRRWLPEDRSPRFDDPDGKALAIWAAGAPASRSEETRCAIKSDSARKQGQAPWRRTASGIWIAPGPRNKAAAFADGRGGPGIGRTPRSRV